MKLIEYCCLPKKHFDKVLKESNSMTEKNMASLKPVGSRPDIMSGSY